VPGENKLDQSDPGGDLGTRGNGRSAFEARPAGAAAESRTAQPIARNRRGGTLALAAGMGRTPGAQAAWALQANRTGDKGPCSPAEAGRTAWGAAGMEDYPEDAVQPKAHGAGNPSTRSSSRPADVAADGGETCSRSAQLPGLVGYGQEPVGSSSGWSLSGPQMRHRGSNGLLEKSVTGTAAG